MRHFLRKLLWFGIVNLTLIMGWVIMMSCFNNSPPAPNNQTVYAGVLTLSGVSSSLSAGPINDANIHAMAYSNDMEYLVTTPYSGSSYMYVEAKVTSKSCADHDHIGPIARSGSGDYGIGVTVNTNNSGTLSLEFKSQCEQDFDSDPTGDGVYFKGTEWYAANNYPLTPQANIVVDVATLVNCQYPGDKKPGATEYGCGSNDAS